MNSIPTFQKCKNVCFKNNSNKQNTNIPKRISYMGSGNNILFTNPMKEHKLTKDILFALLQSVYKKGEQNFYVLCFLKTL